jgi:small ubiquitin-related modifier
LRAPTGEDVLFKVKKSTRFERVMDAYARMKGVEMDSLRFLLMDRICYWHTVGEAGLEDGDIVMVMLEQLGD